MKPELLQFGCFLLESIQKYLTFVTVGKTQLCAPAYSVLREPTPA